MSMPQARTWEDVLDRAGTRDSTGSERSETRLTAILAAALALSPESLHERRAGDFPPGIPSKTTVRRAAQLLLELTDKPRFERSRVRQALAWTQLLRLPQYEVVTDAAPEGEILQSVHNCRHALTVIGEDGDATDRTILLVQLARFLRRSNRSEEAIATLTQHPMLPETPEAGAAPVPAILDDAPFLPPYLTDKLGWKRAEILYCAYRDVNRLDESMRHLDIARKYAHRYADTDPDNFLNTWLWEGHLHRRRRDVRAMVQIEATSKELAERYPQSTVAPRYHSIQISANANTFQDFTRAQEQRYHRLRTRLQRDMGMEIHERPTIEELKEYVAHYRRLGSKARVTWLGNATFDIASGHVRSGETAQDPRIRAYAEGLLDVSETAWEGFATNGINALLSGRARLALMSGDTPTEEVTADLLTANRNAYRSATAQNALATAVRYGVPGSSAVRKRLDELLDSLDPQTGYIAYAKTVGLSAEWWWRRCATDTVEAPWVEAEALRAVRMLRHEGVSLDPESEATAWMTAARAMDMIDNPDRQEQLTRMLRGIRAVTEMMLTVVTTVDRRRVADKFGMLFTEAAALATSMEDHAAADLIMEAVRRDRVGLLLAELARNADIDIDIRSAALAVQDSGSSTADHQTAAENTEETAVADDHEDRVRGRSAEIAIDRSAAVRAAESVLGPLAALADPCHLDTATAAAVLHRRAGQERTTCVLQLLPLPASADTTPGEIGVLRRLSVAIPGKPVRQHTDRVEVSHRILALSAGSPDLFAWRRRYAPLLLPTPLRELLERTPVDAPVRLLIVPTGFFQIPFDALPVTARTYVLDHALVSIHGSLTSMLSLMTLDEMTDPTPAVAIYDHELTHARPELDALLAHLDGVRPVTSVQELTEEMTYPGRQPNSLLAMAVHGSADDHGWGQAKKLTDASGATVWLTAAHALSWTVPRLCVLASCNTPIAAPDGIELGGFPLALMLRGATTVIGGLYNISDRDTSEIMIRFWQHLAAGTSALEALRLAKRAYLQSDPNLRRNPRLWAGLTTYGASTT